MTNIFYHGCVAKLQTDEDLVVEYRFIIAVIPIVVKMCVQRVNNDKTFEELFKEAVYYAELHYMMIQNGDN